MKVLSIEPYTGKDGSDKWQVTFENDKRPLIMATQPTFEAGEIIHPSQLELKQSNYGAFFVFKSESHKDSSERDNAIRGQTAMKIISDIYCAGLLEDFQTHSDNPYIINLRAWVDSALIKDPLIGEMLCQK